MTKEQVRIHSLMLRVSVDASQEEIDRSYNKNLDYHRRTSTVKCCDETGQYRWGGRFDNSPVEKSYRILKKKIRCNGCNEFIIPTSSTMPYCDETCLDFIRTRILLMQEINNKFQQTNLDPASESIELTNTFFNLFDIRIGLNDDCPHDVPFTPQCNDASSIQKTIWEHMANCLKTQPEVENFKNSVINAIERATLNMPINPGPNHWNSWTPPSILRNNNTPNHTNNNNYSSTSNYSSSPSENSFTFSTDEVRETKKEKPTNFPSSDQETSPPSSSDSSRPVPTGGFTIPSEGGSSPTSSQSKPKSEPVPNQPAKPQTKSLPQQPSEISNLTHQEELTKQKQQIIEQIQSKLNQLPNLEEEFTNWQKEIEQIQSLKVLTAYQKSLLEKLESKKSVKAKYHADSVNENKNKTVWVIGIGVLLLSSLIGYLFWKRKVK